MAPQLHQRPPFRAEHLGSLLRPQQLLDAKTAQENGEVSEAKLAEVEAQEIKNIVDIQKELGYGAPSDGEYCRHSKHIQIVRSRMDIIDDISVLGYLLPRSGWL